MHESDTIRVTTAHVEDAGSSTSIDGYRACRLPRGNLQRVERAGDSGGAAGQRHHRHALLQQRDMAGVGEHARPPLRVGSADRDRAPDRAAGRQSLNSVDTGPGTISALAIGALGVTAWVRQPGGGIARDGDVAGARPRWRRRRARPRAADPVRAGALCEGSGPITDLAVRNRTVSWRNAGVERSATLP